MSGAANDLTVGAAYLPLVIEQGADWLPSFSFANDDGSPFNLAGSTVRLQVRAEYGSAATLLDASSLNQLIVLDEQGGKATMNVLAARTAQFAPDLSQLFEVVYGRRVVRLGVYDMHLIAPEGGVTPYLAGPMYIAPAVTKDT